MLNLADPGCPEHCGGAKCLEKSDCGCSGRACECRGCSCPCAACRDAESAGIFAHEQE